MTITPGTAGPEQLFRELKPGETFQCRWQGTPGHYLTSDLSRSDPKSDKPWDQRAAINLETGEAILLPYNYMVAPTPMKAGPA